MTVGQFIKRVGQLAKEIASDPQIKLDRSIKKLTVRFVDGSVVHTSPDEVMVMIPGPMAARFIEAYHKEFPNNTPAPPDIGTEPQIY